MTISRITRLLAIVATAALAATACSASGEAIVVTTTVTPNPSSPAPTSSTLAPGPVGSGAGGSQTPTTSTSSTTTATTPTSASTATTATTTTSSGLPPKPVHVSTFEGDGSTYGIGMAVMVLFSAAPTDSSAFTKAAIVTVNGTPASGAWFWQKPTVPGYAMEALYREKDYWPAHSSIEVDLPLDGLPAGPGLAYDDSLAVTFAIGAAHVSHVNNAQHTMSVTSDGEVVKNFPVSLGSATTPTYDGTKVVMEKDNPERMKSDPGDPDPYDILVPWSVRITNSGEFIHAASWNTGNIGSRNTSHGCTNLDVADAEWFYNFSLIGDVIEYPDANSKGTVQPSWDGWGWWNLPWTQWAHGGALINH